MPQITGVRERRGRARVFVDGEFWAEIDANVALERGLYEGAALSCDELDEARVAGEKALAMSRALNFLAYRSRSEKEVRDRLFRYGYGAETVDGVLERLAELGYLDDEGFARTAAREKSRKYGPRRVSADLMRGGVSGEIARAAVEEAFAEHSEREMARELAARRYNKSERSDAQARRVYGFLVRRGFSADVCAGIAREYRGPDASEADV
ncbi:MAG TPA: regulatory protein RecX [Rubrobacteraceae bacterium]|nr:regulatory protein RecX [Rubrobacteraceae bacterium]